MITKKNNHDHFWIEDGILFESYMTIRGLRYNPILEVEFPDNENCSEEVIEKINWKYFPQEICTHEFISREYLSQPYGTCVQCGKFISH